eukprot:scaffold97056_cov46-Cyclotella_meneghiniana.AAC.4
MVSVSTDNPDIAAGNLSSAATPCVSSYIAKLGGFDSHCNVRESKIKQWCETKNKYRSRPGHDLEDDQGYPRRDSQTFWKGMYQEVDRKGELLADDMSSHLGITLQPPRTNANIFSIKGYLFFFSAFPIFLTTTL